MTTKEEPAVCPDLDEAELSDSELEQVAAGSSDSRHRIKEAGTNAVKNAGKVLSH